ncbi:hypothetical protein QBC39DRAFT_347355 [Podospora conica]|nr:hypothetical protein QBC39DRAFT_347355 [Schizothecium conicum]
MATQQGRRCLVQDAPSPRLPRESCLPAPPHDLSRPARPAPSFNLDQCHGTTTRRIMGLTARACALGLCIAALTSVAAAQSSLAAAEASSNITESVAVLPDCAIPCFDFLIRGSGCNATDAACLCPNNAWQSSPAVCVARSCSVREALTTKRVANEFCSIPIRDNNDLTTVFAVFLGLSGFAVLLRIVARIVTQVYFWWDDAFNFLAMGGCIALTVLELFAVDIGMGMDIWLLDDFDDITRIMIYFFAMMLIYTATRFLIRASIILFYLRVFPPGPDRKIGRILMWTFYANFVYNLSFFMAVLFQCAPIHHFWDHWEGLGNGHCGNVNILTWVAAITGIVFDLWLLALPFPQLMALNLHWKKKLMGILMFGMGALVLIISLIRLKTINSFTRSSNPTRDIVEVIVWSSIEMHVGVICPCLPSFRLLLRKVMPAFISTNTGNYELGERTGATGTREMMGNDGGKDGAAAPAKGIKKEQTIVAREERNSSLPPSEKVSQDDLSNPCDAWSMTELMGTKTEIKGGAKS